MSESRPVQPIIGEAPAFLEMLEHTSRAAPLSKPVLVVGERGTGKELIASRLHFLLTGFYKSKRSFIGFDVPADQAFAFHNNCAHLPTLLYHLHSYGVAFEALEAIRYKAKSVMLWVLFAPLIVPCTWFETHVAQRNVRGTAAAQLLFREVASFRSLCAESWLLMGRKQATGPVVEVKSRMPEWAALVP